MELLTFLGLALLVEGVAFALFPDALRRAMASLALMEPARLRVVGLTAVVGAAALLFFLSEFAEPGHGGALGFWDIRGAIASLL